MIGDGLARPIVGVRVTLSGYFGLAVAALWSAYSPIGIIAYLRDTRARGDYVPASLDWVPAYIWPQRPPAPAAAAAAAEEASPVDDAGGHSGDEDDSSIGSRL